MNKSLKIFLVLAMLMALAITTHTATPSEKENLAAGTQEPTSLGGITASSFLARRSDRFVMTCDNYPRVCSAKAQDCCKKKCVNVFTDSVNCGKCGKKCKYSEICCESECVDPMSNRNHCGTCNNKCKKGSSSCVYGMCSYA